MQPARNFDDVDLASTAYGRRGISRAVARATARERAQEEQRLLRELGLDRLQPNDNWGFIDPKVFAELRDRPARVKEFGTEALEAIQSGARDYAWLPRSEYNDYTSTTAGKAKEYFSNLRKTQPKLYEKLRKEAEERWESPELRRWDRLMSPAARALGMMERMPAKTAEKLYNAVPRQDDRFAIVRGTVGNAAKKLLAGTETGKKVEKAAGLVDQAQEIVKTPVGRRGFLQMLGGAGAALAQKPGEAGPAPTDWYKKLAGMLKEEGIDFSLAPMWRLETQTQGKGAAVKPDKWFGHRVQEEKPNLAPYTQYSGDTIHKRAAQFPGAKLQYTYPQRTPSGNIDPEVLTLPAESPFTPERGQAYYDAARKALAGEKPWEEALRKHLIDSGISEKVADKLQRVIENKFGEAWDIDPAAKFAGTVAKAKNNLISGNKSVLEEGLDDIRQKLAQRLMSAAEKESFAKQQKSSELWQREKFLNWQDALTHGGKSQFGGWKSSALSEYLKAGQTDPLRANSLRAGTAFSVTPTNLGRYSEGNFANVPGVSLLQQMVPKYFDGRQLSNRVLDLLPTTGTRLGTGATTPEEAQQAWLYLNSRGNLSTKAPDFLQAITKALGWDIDPETWLKFLQQK